MPAKLHDMSNRTKQNYPMDRDMPLAPSVMRGAAFDLGLAEQVKGETEEQRKKRMKEIDAQKLLGGAAKSLFEDAFSAGY